MKLKQIALCMLFINIFFINLSVAEYFDGIFIIVNDDAVSYNEFISKYKKVRGLYDKSPERTPADLKMIIFNSLINEKLIEQVADKKEVFVSDTELDEAIENIRKLNRLSQAEFKQALANEGRTPDDLRKDYRQQLLNEKIMQIELPSRIQYPTEEEVKEYYDKNKKDRYAPPKIKLSHILIRDNPNASLAERKKIKNKAQAVLKRALNGENFVKLVKECSDDEVTLKQKGDLGYFSKDSFYGDFMYNGDVFKIGTDKIIPEIIQSRRGWNIMKVTEKTEKELIPYNEMKARIESYLVKKKMAAEFENWIKDQMRDSYIEIIFPDNEKYIYDYKNWKKKNAKKVISEKDFKQKIDSLKI